MAVGVDVQQPKALGVIVSQVPPVVEVAVALKAKFAPVLAAVIICGNGSLPPKVLLKLSAGTGSKLCAQTEAGRATATNNRKRSRLQRRAVAGRVRYSP